jgi:hypothetical protein
MNKGIKYLITYVVWIADLVLTLWFAYLCRTSLIGIFALFYTGNVAYANAVNFIDKVFIILLGLGWLVFMIMVEQYFRNGIDGNLQRLSSVTGWVLVCVFSVDLILAWIQGMGSGNWLRWLILAIELGVGIVLLVLAKTRFTSQSN